MITIPGALKIRFRATRIKLSVALTVKDTQAGFYILIPTNSAIWLPSRQKFTGQDSEALNEKLDFLKQYFSDVYVKYWEKGQVTAEMLKHHYCVEFPDNINLISGKPKLPEKKEEVMAQIANVLKNNPRGSNRKLKELNQILLNLEEKEIVVPQPTVPLPSPKEMAPIEQNRTVKHRMKVRFIIRKQRPNSLGECPLMCRLTINAVKSPDFSTGIKTLPADWDSKYQAIRGNETETAKLNEMRAGLEKVYQEFRKKGKKPFAEEIKAHYFDHELEFDRKWKMEDLLDLQLRELHRRKRSHPTILKYQRIYTLFQNCINLVNVEDVKKSHINDFWHWMKAQGYSQNYCNKSVQAIYGLFEHAVNSQIITHNPCKGLHYEWDRKVDLTSLTIEEVELLKTTSWDNKLQKVVDSFLFMCYTGLHITDYIQLEEANVKSERGQRWIEYERQKNGQIAMIPLHPYVVGLINKYGGIGGLPRISTQKQNDFLKVVASKIGFEGNLTNKVGRKTFTDMSINDRGMSFESVAAMLGHASTRFVRVYGRVKLNRLFNEWKN